MSGTLLSTGSLESGQTLLVRRVQTRQASLLPVTQHSKARHNPVHRVRPGNSKPQLHGNCGAQHPHSGPLRKGAGVSPTDGFPRTATFAASARRSLPAGQGRPLGVPEQPAPRTAQAGTPLRGKRPSSGPPSQLQAEAPARPDPPSEARYLGRGWGRDGGQGSGKRAQRRQGQLQQGKLPRRREDSVGKGKTPPAPRGGGEKSRAQARGIDKARKISRYQQTLANVRSGHVTPGVL